MAASIKCVECGKAVGGAAATCPRCGAPMPDPTASGRQSAAGVRDHLKWIGGVLLAIVLVVVVAQATGT